MTLAERRDFYSYVQWIAHQQWRDVKAYAEAQGVALMGDIPFGISYYSADVFAHPDGSRSTGRAALHRSHISRTTNLRKSGAKTGASRSIAGM